MVRALITVLILVAALLPSRTDAAHTSSAFRVGITIEYSCHIARASEAADVAIACDAPTASTTRAISAGTAWPRLARLDRTNAVLREVGESDNARLIVVEF